MTQGIGPSNEATDRQADVTMGPIDRIVQQLQSGVGPPWNGPRPQREPSGSLARGGLVLPRVRAITNETRVSTSARWTPSLGRSRAACLHAFPAPALCSGRDPMVACGLWRIAKAAGHGPRRASGVGAAHVECGKDTRISTLVVGSMRSP